MGRSPCCEKSHTNKGTWTKEEDQRLTDFIQIHGQGSWHSLPKSAGLLRCGKSCRLRWTNYLRPDLKRGNFTEDEDEIIIKLHSLHGNRWSLIAGRLPGRTDNEIKNYWNTHIKRKLLSRGIDPQSHHSSASTCRCPFPKTETNSSENGASTSGTSTTTDELLFYSTNDRREQELNLDLTLGSGPTRQVGSDLAYRSCLCNLGSHVPCTHCQTAKRSR